MGSESTKTGFKSLYNMAEAVEENVREGTNTFLPLGKPNTRSARCNAAVAELRAMAASQPMNSAHFFSNSATFGP